jgi:hypothetical protein
MTKRRYWLWVTRPEYYLDENGHDREFLQPGAELDRGDWWTCHRETAKDDLVLLYRTKPRSDIAYLLMARDDAYYIGDHEYAWEMGWDYGCDWEPLYRFSEPLSIADMRAYPGLGEWGPLRAQFRSRVYQVDPATWRRLTEALGSRNRGFKSFLRTLQGSRIVRTIRLEEEIEDDLSADLSRLRRHGWNLKLWHDPDTGLPARQFVCGTGGAN